MATPRSRPQTIAFVPQGTNQAKGARTLPLGALVEATNVRQTKEDEWRKRLGFARTVPASGAFFSAGGMALAAGAPVWRDSVGQFWWWDSAAGDHRHLGSLGASGARPFPTYQDAGITLSGVRDTGPPRRSVTVLGANNDVWTFTVGDGRFQYTVVGADGSFRKTASSVTHANIEQLAAAYWPAQGAVYVLAMTSVGTAVTAFAFNHSSYIQSGSATYQSGMTGITSLDMAYLSSPGEMAVVVAQYDTGTPRCRVTHSYLDPATLTPKGSPAATNLDVTPNANRPDTCGGVSILISSGQTTWYYSFWRASVSANTLDLVLNSVTTSTLANAGSVVLASTATNAGADWRGVTSGYVDTGNGNRVVYAQSINPDSTTAWSYDWDVRRYTYNGSSTTTLLVAAGSWLASKPCLLNGAWYFITGRDSGYNSQGTGATYVEPTRVGELYLRSADGTIVSQVHPGSAVPVWHRFTSHYNSNLGLTQINQYDQFVTTLVAPSATRLLAALGRAGETFVNFSPILTSWAFDAAFGPPAAYGGDLALFPGPIPVVAGPRDLRREMFPLHPPPVPRSGTLGSTGVAQVCATYRYRDSGARPYESSPSPSVTQTTWSGISTVSVATLKHTLGVGAEICLYATPDGGSILVLQAVVPNDPSVNSVTIPIWPIVSDFPQTTPLYTNGGGLSNAVPPPCRSVTVWRDRLHLSGTPTDGEVWHSQEIVEGLAPTFSEILRSFWQDAQGPILGLKAVDWNYLAGFKRNGIGVIGGPGPDGRGQGAYVWQTLTTEKGLSDTALNSLLSTPFGAAFQNEADGRICLVSTGLQVQDIMQGADSHRSLTVGATLLHEAERQAWFYCTDGTLLVLEYAWAGETKKLVECWRKWTSSGLLRAYGAVMTPSGPLHIESNGVIRSPAAATWRDAMSGGQAADYSHAVETGRLAPFGMLMEGAVVGAHIMGENIDSDGDSVLQVDVYPDDSLVPSSHEIFPVTSTPMDYSMKPAGCFRCKEVRVRIEEFTAGNIEGTVFHGVALDVVPSGRTRILPVGQRIA